MNLFNLGGSFLSAASSAVAPRQAARPAQRGELYRPLAPSAVRFYQAAQDNRLTGGMANEPLSADAITQQTLHKLRARSRQEAAINDYARRFLSLLDTNIVGPAGIILRPQIMNPDGKPDELANRTIEDRWNLWTEKGACDITGVLSWLDVQSLTVRTTATDGEILLREVIGPEAGPQGYALQVIDPELVSVDDNRQLPSGNIVRMGVEYDRLDRPVAYWIMEPDRIVGTMGTGYYGRDVYRVPAGQIIHVFNPERAGQHRGMPWMSTSLLRLAILEGMEDAALVAARVGASKLGWFTREPGAQGQYTGESVGPNGEIHVDADPGTFGELPVGTRLEKWDPGYPSGEFGPFVKAVLRGISSGLGVPYVSLSSDLEGVNYSSIRHGMLEARELYKRMQTTFVDSLCKRVYRRWLEVQLLSGALAQPNGSPLPAHKLEKFRRVSFQTPRWDWVDPLKETQAQELQIARGTMTESEAIRQRGRDPEAVWQERRREIDRKAELGLVTVQGPQQIIPALGEGNPPASEQ